MGPEIVLDDHQGLHWLLFPDPAGKDTDNLLPGLLLILSKVYAVTNEQNRWMTEVPKQIAEGLNLDILPNG